VLTLVARNPRFDEGIGRDDREERNQDHGDHDDVEASRCG
jgi:hypothetical protein